MVHWGLHLLDGVWEVKVIISRPPYVAGNMVDLLKLIKSKPLTLPHDPPICAELGDVLKRMLVADVKRRIEWHDLFKHPVNNVLTKKKIGEAQL